MRGLWFIGMMVASTQLSAASLWRIDESIAMERANAAHPAAIAAVRISPMLNAFDESSSELELLLPDGTQIVAQRTDGVRRGVDDYSWVGHAGGDREQQVVLTRVGDFLAGYLSLGGGVYEVTPSAEGTLLLKLDSSRFPDCAGAVATSVPAAAQRAPQTQVQAQGEGSDQPIDVLMVFSPGSTTQLGGEPQALAFAQSAVDSANLAFSNSQMLARFQLVGVRHTTRADSGASLTDLMWLVNDPEVAGWRNEVRADLVGMTAEFSNACGQGFLMGSPPGVGFAPSAFQVTARNCAVGNLSYAHEHGHNMGFQHNPEDGSGPAYPYAFGHYVSGSYRTVMSYATPCVGGCTRRPYFSNPDVMFMGTATGVADARDNARAGNQTAPIVAAFRSSEFFASGFE